MDKTVPCDRWGSGTVRGGRAATLVQITSLCSSQSIGEEGKTGKKAELCAITLKKNKRHLLTRKKDQGGKKKFEGWSAKSSRYAGGAVRDFGKRKKAKKISSGRVRK